MEKKETLKYMTYYRGFAIVMIVMVHCVTRFLKGNATFEYGYAFLAHSTNLFLFISGFLFEYLLYKKYPFKVFVEKKVRRLIIPYLFWALPVALVFFVLKGFDFKYLGWTMWTGLGHSNEAHWYIHFIFLVFLISPVYVWLQNKKLLYPFVMPLFLLITLFSGRAEKNILFCEMNVFPLIGMFFLGMFFSHYRNKFVERLYKYDCFFILVGLVIVFLQGYYHLNTTLSFQNAITALMDGSAIMNYFSLNKIFLSVGFLLVFYRISRYVTQIPLLEKLAHYSFAIYFVHVYILSCVDKLSHILGLYKLGLESTVGGVLYFLLMSAIVISLSACVIYILRKIPFTKDIVGV